MKENAKRNDLTTGKEWKVILLFTLPIMAGYLLQQLYSIVDGVIVGNFVSEAAFAAVATCQPLTALYLALAVGLSVGVGVVISQYYGAEKKDKLPVAIDTAIILLGVCGLSLTLFGVILSPFLLKNVLNVPDDILTDAITYIRIYSVGLLFQFLYNGIAATLRSFGDSKATLYFLLIAAVLSTVLTFAFILLVKWGVAGAAFSTVLAQFVCVIVSFIYLRTRFPHEKASRRWDREIAGTMIKLGLPIAVQMGVVSFGNGAMQRLVNGFEGTAPGVIAAYGAAVRLDMFIYVPITGFQSGLASFTGQNIGAGRLDRVRRGFVYTIIMSMSVTLLVTACVNIFAVPIVTMFGLTGNALLIGVERITFMTLFFWMFSGYMTLGGLLQGAGDTVLQSVATLSALVLQVTTGYLTVHLGLLGYTAAWITTPFGWGLAIIITYTRYFTGGWKKKAVAGKLSAGGNS